MAFICIITDSTIEKQRKAIFTEKDLCGLQQVFYLAQEMGKGLGGS